MTTRHVAMEAAVTLQARLTNVPHMFSEGIEEVPDAAAARRGVGALLVQRLRAVVTTLVPSLAAPRLATGVRHSTQGV